MKPKVFVASSAEGLEIAQSIEESLAVEAEIVLWDRAFGLSRGFLDTLVQAARDVDFAIVVLTADDTTQSRGRVQGAPRDNLLFELGLFMGRLGRERTFFVMNADALPKVPSDLGGITAAVFTSHPTGDLRAALGPICNKIRRELRELGTKERALEGESPPPSLGFTALANDLAATLDRLEADEHALLGQVEPGDLSRLFDGLYAHLLFTGRAILGAVRADLYANAMELDASREALRVRYFAAPYNEEIILRSFPLHGMRQGVASVALITQAIQVRNDMAAELKERGEDRLKAMAGIPVESAAEAAAGSAVVLNIDSVTPGVFPGPGSAGFDVFQGRGQTLRELARRINRLRALALAFPGSPQHRVGIGDAADIRPSGGT